MLYTSSPSIQHQDRVAMDADDENVTTFGTPLEYDDSEEEVPRKKPIPIEHQVVKDERGLRRFHGAFTGGFSAGYFNTAGSKEGWAPASFLSSRSSRANKGGQKPEDFMDAEDLGEFGIAPRSIHVTKDFREESSSESARKRTFHDLFGSAIPGIAPLQDFVVPVRDSVGITILRNLGWKSGQGIGPRVKLSQRLKMDEPDNSKENVGEKIYGCSLPTNTYVENALSDTDEITVPPDDVTVKLMITKENLSGLGYTALSKTPVLATIRGDTHHGYPIIDKNKKLAIRGEAFGVGAFEEDDESVYSFDDMNQYDFELCDTANSEVPQRQKSKSNEVPNYIGNILEGFHLSSKTVPSKKFYPPPFLPKTFHPFHAGVITDDKPADHHAHNQSKVEVQELNSALVPSKPSPITTGSVFDLLKPEDRIRLQTVRNALNNSELVRMNDAAGCSLKKPLLSKSNDIISEVLQPVQQISDTGVFKPFLTNTDKQKRYDIYKKLKDAKKEDEFSKCQPRTMTEWEQQKEYEEFQRASSIFQPLSFHMASRFVSAKNLHTEELTAGLMTQKSDESRQTEEKSTPIKAKRETFEWHPDRLLCRRFNVQNPYPESQLVGVLKIKHDKYSIFNFLTHPNDSFTNNEETSASLQNTSTPVEGGVPDAVCEKRRERKESNLFAGLISEDISKSNAATNALLEVYKDNTSATNENEEEMTDKRPPIDLFKAIFQDSESENEAADECIETNNKPPDEEPALFVLENLLPVQTLPPATINMAERHTKVTSGLFKNVDLENTSNRLHSRVETADTNKIPSVAVQLSNNQIENETSRSSSDYYGPSLPPPTNNCYSDSHHIQTKEDSDSYTWVEAKQKKHKYKKIMKKKHRKARHKHKKGLSDKDRSISSSDEGSTDEDKLDDLLIRKSKMLHSCRR